MVRLTGRQRPAPRPGARRSRGFTLVELLVVIALMAVLAGLLLPVLRSVRERACQAACLSNLRQIGQAQHLYLQDWDERFPDWFTKGPPRPRPLGAFRYWTEYFQPYLRSEVILRDPGAQWPDPLPEGEKLAEYPLVSWGRHGRGSSADTYWQWPGSSLSLADVARPAETLALVDGWTTPDYSAMHLRRHHGGMNASFVDGHTRWLAEGEFWHLDTNGQGFYWMHYAAADR